MAFSLLVLLDDIASALDDVAAMTKVSMQKTAGVLGDDLALNAQQVAGVKADRELPVVWAVAKGSLLNKAILVPAALLISALAPALVTALLMLGGAFLCFEGAEKLAHKFLGPIGPADAHGGPPEIPLPGADPAALEKEKIKGAVRTDFVLSAEIVAITLGQVAGQPFAVQLVVLASIAVVVTAGVYGLVAGIVKLDDAGLHLIRRPGRGAQAAGRAILALAPWLMKLLSVAGTAAMFLVGGGILVHGLPALHHVAQAWQIAGGPVGAMAPVLLNAAVGVAVGAALVALVALAQAVRRH
ncbi:MAG: DUF808 domain-containing protein [Ottowia sp.]